MDKIEANEILARYIEDLRMLSYAELCKYLNLVDIDTPEVIGKSGVKYQLEIHAFWDNKPNVNLRVMVSIDDGGWRSYKPLTSDFIIDPDGTFVGE